MVQLPPGRIEETRRGGADVLQIMVRDLVASEGDGYIRIERRPDAGLPRIGYMVFRNGQPSMALHESDIDRTAIEAALASGLLEPAGEQLWLVGEGDAPAEEPVLADDAPDLFHRVVAAVAEATGDSQREVIRKVNRGQKTHYGIRPATEALLLAADAGVDVAPFLDEALGNHRAAVVADLEARLLVGRIGRPEEAAAAVIFMMETGYVTGSCLTIDGGGSLI